MKLIHGRRWRSAEPKSEFLRTDFKGFGRYFPRTIAFLCFCFIDHGIFFLFLIFFFFVPFFCLFDQLEMFLAALLMHWIHLSRNCTFFYIFLDVLLETLKLLADKFLISAFCIRWWIAIGLPSLPSFCILLEFLKLVLVMQIHFTGKIQFFIQL